MHLPGHLASNYKTSSNLLALPICTWVWELNNILNLTDQLSKKKRSLCQNSLHVCKWVLFILQKAFKYKSIISELQTLNILA